MQAAGIIAELNPFHFGHQYVLQKAKTNADAVVVAMSGNFVERGEAALLSDRYRAKMALLCGADLVLQLPLPYALSSAQTFAFGGVSLLEQTKVVDALYFGSECGDARLLQQTAQKTKEIEQSPAFLSLLQKGLSYPSARSRAMELTYGKTYSAVLENPNDILAIEYISALSKLQSSIHPVPIARVGANHDAKIEKDGFISASFLREKIQKGENVSAFMPQEAYSVLEESIEKGFAPSSYKALDLAILSFLRTATEENFENVPDVSEGLHNRILSAAKTATSLEELFMLSKTKRYTHARIRRIVLSAFLGVRKDMSKEKVPYLHVLGATSLGIALLKEMEQKADLPILKRASDAKKLTGRAKAIFELECKATDIYNLTLPKIRPTGTEMTDAALFLQDF